MHRIVCKTRTTAALSNQSLWQKDIITLQKLNFKLSSGSRQSQIIMTEAHGPDLFCSDCPKSNELPCCRRFHRLQRAQAIAATIPNASSIPVSCQCDEFGFFKGCTPASVCIS